MDKDNNTVSIEAYVDEDGEASVNMQGSPHDLIALLETMKFRVLQKEYNALSKGDNHGH